MTVAVTAAHGAFVKIGNSASPEYFYYIDGVHNGPNGPVLNARVIEAAHHGSTTVLKKASLRDNGQVTFDIYYDSTDTNGHAVLLTNHDAKTVTNFQMIITDTGAEQYSFAAIISQLSYSGQVEGFNVYSVTLDVSGAVTRS